MLYGLMEPRLNFLWSYFGNGRLVQKHHTPSHHRDQRPETSPESSRKPVSRPDGALQRIGPHSWRDFEEFL